MSQLSRRDFLRTGAMGLAVIGASGLTLRADAAPTPGAGDFPGLIGLPPVPLTPTEDNILGPFYRTGSPFRAKIGPPLSAGTVMLIRGRVWSFQTKRPLPNTVLDIWQANSLGKYDNDDPANPPAATFFQNRARVLTDETGYYEFETVHPGRYPLDETRLRPSHVHYRLSHPAHKTLITQLYFKGDPYNAGDPYIKDSLIITLQNLKVDAGSYESGNFDIVLEAQ